MDTSLASNQFLNELVLRIDSSVKHQIETNLRSYPRFLKASDVSEIITIISMAACSITSYFDQYYPDHNISLYSGILSTVSLSFSILAKYFNKEAKEREIRINNILKSLENKRPPVELGITEM